MPTSLQAIANKARKSRKHRFQNLYHLLNRVNLKTCFFELKENAAPGVDNIYWQTYEANLEENLRNLNARLRDGSYRAQPIRRKYIPKSNGKLRPLGIPLRIVESARLLWDNSAKKLPGLFYRSRPKRLYWAADWIKADNSSVIFL